MQPKKVLYVVSTADFIDHFLSDSLVYFASNRDYQFTIACSPDVLLEELAEKCQFIAYPINIYRSYTPLSDIMVVRKLRKLIRIQQFDLVIGHTPKGALLAMIAAKMEGVCNRVYYRHGILYQTAKGLKRSLLKLFEKLTAYCATSTINISRSVEEFSLMNKLNPPEKDIFLGTNGSCGAINPIKFSKQFVDKKIVEHFKNENNIKSKDIIIGYFGRLVNDKGINELIEAWGLIIENYSNVKLIMAGEFEDRDALPALTKVKIQSNPTIIYLDYLKQLEVIYATLDIFILPSYREGLPTVILEASSMELPVITTRVTGCVDAIIENETGIFCTHDPENIAEKISFYIDNPKIRKLHGRNGRKFVIAHFDQAKIWEDFENKVLKL